MSARQKFGLTLAGALVVFGFGAYAVFAAGGKQDFSIAASPASQTITQGQATTYTVNVTRVNGFTGSVSLSASSLPSGATASWKLSNGTASNVVPPSLNSATLTIQTAASTPNGTFQPLITGTSANLTHTATVALVVQPAAQPNFTVTASPANQTVLQGDLTSYSVTVTRTGGFSGSVSLSVTGLPNKTTASWSPSSTLPGSSSVATLQIETASNTQTGNYTLSITGTGTIGSGSVSRSAAPTMTVLKTQSFEVTGNLAGQLAPGNKAPLNLLLTNPYNFAIKITNLSVAVEEGTSKAGCSGTQNFKVTPIPAVRYPITLPAGPARTLDQLGVPNADKPQVEMLNRPWSQEACKNVTVTLAYGGSARK